VERERRGELESGRLEEWNVEVLAEIPLWREKIRR